jgi:molybdate transport system ATP-binding protein
MSEGLRVSLHAAAPIPLAVELSCAPDQVLALVGPSGAGKSTALRAIAGLHRPRQARIACDGAVWTDTAQRVFLPPHRRRVGLVFQSYALFPHMTAQQNVEAAMDGAPAAERAARARDLLRMVHLDGLEDRRPARLSGGQQQRVAVARALARDPAVLLLDEPFASVDKGTRQRLYAELAELRAQISIPTILVTHDFDEAARLADTMCLLDHGAVLQVGAPADVLARPAGVRAARLVDLKNMFAGRVLRHDGAHTRIGWNGRELAAPRHDSFAPGAEIVWALPSTQVILHGPGRPADSMNIVEGRIAALAALSESTSVTVEVAGPAPARLSMTVPAQFVRRTGLAPGAPVSVELLADAIHVMAAE